MLAMVSALVTAAVIVVAILGFTELAALLAEPGVVTALLAANLAIAVLRLISAHHAWFAAGGRRLTAALALAALVIGPHGAVAYVGIEAKDTLEAVFAAPAATTTTRSTTTSATTTVNTDSAPPSTAPPSTTPPSTTRPSTTTTIRPPDPFADRVNVLLLGGDAGRYRSGLRTDSVIVASVDRFTGDAALFSLPRNWGGLTVLDGSPVPNRILNEVYEWGRRQPERFAGPDPGAAALVEVAEILTGLDIHHFVLVDLTGFAAVVDALGGVTIDVPRSVYGPRYNPATGGYTMISIPRGEQVLDGGAVLAYVRERYQSSDYDRMDRQRCVLAAMADEMDPIGLMRGLTELLDAVETHVTTDVPLDELPALIRVAGRVGVGEIRVMGFDNTWRSGWDARGFAIPDLDRIHTAIHETITDPEAAAKSFGITEADEECG